jgi:small subunit ribosomal protein S16
MSVRIRLTRIGRKNRPFFRIGAYDSRTRREGRAIEILGTYDPYIVEDDKKVVVDADRLRHWISVGARPSEVVSNLIRRSKIQV